MRLLYAFVLLVGVAGASEKKLKTKSECRCGVSFSQRSSLISHLEKFRDGLISLCVCGCYFSRDKSKGDQLKKAYQKPHARSEGHKRGSQHSCYYCTATNFRDASRFNADRMAQPPTFANKDAQKQHINAKHVKELSIDDDVLGSRTIIVAINDNRDWWINHSFEYLQQKANKKAKKSSQEAKGVKRKRTPSSGSARSSKRQKRSSAS